MNYIQFLYVFVALVPLSVFLDCHNTQKAQRQEDYEFDENARASDIVMLFSPFFALFYADTFWLVLAGITAITAVGMLLQYIAKISNRLRSGPELMAYNLLGVTIILLLIYWFGFHDGVAILDLSAKDHEASNAQLNDSLGWTWWPYASYALLGVYVAVICSVEKLQSSGIWVLMAVFNILPFFTDYYWTSLMLGVLFYYLSLTVLARRWGTGSGAAAAFLIFYMFALGGSVLVYLFLVFFGLSYK